MAHPDSSLRREIQAFVATVAGDAEEGAASAPDESAGPCRDYHGGQGPYCAPHVRTLGDTVATRRRLRQSRFARQVAPLSWS